MTLFFVPDILLIVDFFAFFFFVFFYCNQRANISRVYRLHGQEFRFYIFTFHFLELITVYLYVFISILQSIFSYQLSSPIHIFKEDLAIFTSIFRSILLRKVFTILGTFRIVFVVQACRFCYMSSISLGLGFCQPSWIFFNLMQLVVY